MNEKYEVKKHMRRFVQVIVGGRANKETTAWRKVPRKKIIGNRRQQQLRSEQKALDARNEKMRIKLLKIMSEDRTKTTNVVPGVRCSTADNIVKFRNLHSRGKQIEKNLKKLEEQNQLLKTQLENVQPTITQDIEDEEFK